jgi:topoisomerase-4 subunit A
LRALRRLEEIEISQENAKLLAEAEKLRALLGSPQAQRQRVSANLAELRARYGPETALGRRRTSIEAAPNVTFIPLEAMIEREPLTIIASAKGWIRAMKGHVELASAEAVKFKEGDGAGFAFHAYTTDKIIVAADNGRFYTLAAGNLPGGRGFGEPVRLMVDIEAEANLLLIDVCKADTRWLLVASDGRGFVASSTDLLAETRKGRQVVNPREGARLQLIRQIAAGDDYLAVIGENRKLLIFALNDLPVMARGQGVALQKYKDGGLSDAISFALADGLSWRLGGSGTRTRTEVDLTAWVGARASAGRLPPQGFPRDNKFG